MPSYAIHLAIANEMIRKNKNNIIDNEKFILGSITPDLEKGENKFHLGLITKYVKESLKDDFDKGCFLHVLTDEKFYFYDFREEYIPKEDKNIKNWTVFYSDYNKLNKKIIEKYKVISYPKEIEEYMVVEENGDTEILKEEKIFKFIDDISDLRLDKIINNLRKVLD